MNARVSAKTRRRAVTVAAGTYLAGLVGLVGRVPLDVFNILLIVAVVPLVWLISAFCIWSAHQHATRYARDIEKIHGMPLTTTDAKVMRELNKRRQERVS